MKELKDYTTKELKEELKRRSKEERLKRLSVPRKTEYAYATAVVGHINKYASFNRKYSVKISEEDVQTYNISEYRVTMDVARDVSINVADAPKIGDVVKLRGRKTKSNPTGFGCFANPVICEVIKRYEE